MKPLQSQVSPRMVSAVAVGFGNASEIRLMPLQLHSSEKSIALRCQGLCSHVQIQGSYTKSSATYVPKLTYGLAFCIARGVFQMRRSATEEAELPVEGRTSWLTKPC